MFFIGTALFVTLFYLLAILGNTANEPTFFGRYFWVFGGTAIIIAGIYCIYVIKATDKNKVTLIMRFSDITIKYSFLIKQLVSRDFKTKYKRSVLGVCWSFLNPLLMMSVQYVIFSTLFKGGLTEYKAEAYATYLLIGVVVFNFFSESCSMGLTSIVGNASLITKVYVPKYIYPVTRVFSSGINLIFALIPIFIIMPINGIYPDYHHLLLIFDLALLVLFCMGFAMFLSAIMVFFRDMQFLWGVITTVWMYATPIFYEIAMIEKSTSPWVAELLKVNPLYHYLTFARTILIKGTAPKLITIAICILCTLLSLILGIAVFKKLQNKFTLYI